MTIVAFDDRRKLRDAIIAYMDGTIRTYAFDDLNSECMDSHDEGVRKISKLLYQIHDDTVDHPISLTQTTWDKLLRIVAFLETDLTAATDMDNDHWPFKDDTEWNCNRPAIAEIDVPSYTPQIHRLPVHGSLNRIPTLVGLGILACVIALIFVGLIATR